MPNNSNVFSWLKKVFKNEYIEGEDEDELNIATFFIYLMIYDGGSLYAFSMWSWYGVIFCSVLFLLNILWLLKYGK
jgi:hypothetical protein